MFIHGGYWRMFSKRDYSCVAEPITAAGAIAAILDYTLMPKVRMARLVDEVRRARRWILDTIGAHGGDPGRLTVSGHSAGAHLATFLFHAEDGPSGIREALLLGGLYDLGPLQTSFLQAEIALTDDEVAAFTPMTQTYDPAARVSLALGAEETPPFHEQAKAFKALLRRQGLAASLTALENANHMSSVRDLAVPGTDAAALMTAVVRKILRARRVGPRRLAPDPRHRRGDGGERRGLRDAGPQIEPQRGANVGRARLAPAVAHKGVLDR